MDEDQIEVLEEMYQQSIKEMYDTEPEDWTPDDK